MRNYLKIICVVTQKIYVSDPDRTFSVAGAFFYRFELEVDISTIVPPISPPSRSSFCH